MQDVTHMIQLETIPFIGLYLNVSVDVGMDTLVTINWLHPSSTLEVGNTKSTEVHEV